MLNFHSVQDPGFVLCGLYSLNSSKCLFHILPIIIELQRVYLYKTLICYSGKVCLSDHSFTCSPLLYGTGILLIRRKIQNNQSINQSINQVFTLHHQCPLTMHQLHHDTPDIPLNILHKTLQQLVSMSVYICLFVNNLIKIRCQIRSHTLYTNMQRMCEWFKHMILILLFCTSVFFYQFATLLDSYRTYCTGWPLQDQLIDIALQITFKTKVTLHWY